MIIAEFPSVQHILLMNKFIDSKNNLDIFARIVKEIERMIGEGIESYQESKDYTSEVLDIGNGN